MDPVNTIMSGVGLLTGMEGNRRAGNAAARAAARQDELLARQIAAFDAMKGIADRWKRYGLFSPARQIAGMEQNAFRLQDRERGRNLAGMMASGYRPGDSELALRDDAIRGRISETFARQGHDIARQAMQDELAAYGSANPGALSEAIGVYGQRIADANAGQRDVLPFIGDLLSQAQNWRSMKSPNEFIAGGDDRASDTDAQSQVSVPAAPRSQPASSGYRPTMEPGDFNPMHLFGPRKKGKRQEIFG